MDVLNIPNVEEAPPNAAPSRVWAKARGWSRRRALGAAGGAFVASGLVVLDAFPWAKPRPALAAAYEEWSNCSPNNYFSNGTTVCTPTNVYFGSLCCDGSWHKSGTASGTCYSYSFYHHPTLCAGKNAWRWTGSGNHRKCSDGTTYYQTSPACGGTYINSQSICRTAI